MEHFKTSESISYQEFLSEIGNEENILGLSRVLYKTKYMSFFGDEVKMVPASGAVAIVLRFGTDKIDNIENIKKSSLLLI